MSTAALWRYWMFDWMMSSGEQSGIVARSKVTGGALIEVVKAADVEACIAKKDALIKELRDQLKLENATLRAKLEAIERERDKYKALFIKSCSENMDYLVCLPNCDGDGHEERCPVAYPSIAFDDFKQQLAAARETIERRDVELGKQDADIVVMKATVERLRSFVESVAGDDCYQYDKFLSPTPCGTCQACEARKLMAWEDGSMSDNR